ncbi:hypothetical protein LTR10_019119 [Elasticomyces elasticus]|uniref:Uncharacterized protein n=1 Tax=Exophiala sideris TaxID=1016849 RepID=A0ABR0JH33_9EURO|nr:hypothetical protein LTR10_019119 [Elasticomyces elasticus]KAK5033473.1 hypothetical protein LTS07_003777 [Exophiala sideris]KAK5042032.1 hypothetical protein LTR13_001838 [Exophiala sideris]KAK5064017.1 hypothetical protein LTR69_003785 [Exophiala sideris]KAK5185300.1 hypothetical protein LTR44_002289 [Eurotiomycetes sp. CCFEE 6388]
MSRRYSSGSEGDYVLMPVKSHGGSEYSRGRRRPTRVAEYPEELVINNNLLVPGGSRPRASSTGERPTQTIINVAGSERGHSRSRSRGRGGHYDSRSSSSDYYTGRSRSRHRPHSKVYEDDLSYSLRKELTIAREDQAKKARDDEKRRWQLEEEERRIKRQKEREAILLEAKLEEEKKKEEQKKLRERILREEEERIKKEKDKKKAEEEEFERKVKEKFMSAGYSPEYVEEILHKKKQERATLAIDLHRPTFIKVNRKYLHPDTLDYYGLPWEWDSRDTEYIIIKKYIDNTFQDELFEHTRRLKERKLITTGPYVKETTKITTLTPNEFVKRGDKMYVVRSKSKSPGRRRSGSWMFS